MKHHTYVDPLYANSTHVDEKTGLPKDYNSLFAAYRTLVLASAGRIRIPYTDQEDAAQEVQLKFWLKDKLHSMYDPSRGTKFSALYRSWTQMFMLQERDKSIKFNSRYGLMDPQEMLSEDSDFATDALVSFESEWIQDNYLTDWVENATQALEDSGREHLVPLLSLCLKVAEEGRKPSRQEIAEATGVKLAKSTALLKELRAALTELGMGMETLYV